MEIDLHIEISHPIHGSHNARHSATPLAPSQDLVMPENDLCDLFLTSTDSFLKRAPTLHVLEAGVCAGGHEHLDGCGVA